MSDQQLVELNEIMNDFICSVSDYLYFSSDLPLCGSLLPCCFELVILARFSEGEYFRPVYGIGAHPASVCYLLLCYLPPVGPLYIVPINDLSSLLSSYPNYLILEQLITPIICVLLNTPYNSLFVIIHSSASVLKFSSALS